MIDLRGITGIGLEVRLDTGGTGRIRRQYLHTYGGGAKHVLNSPAEVHLDHGKLGKLLREATRIPSEDPARGDQS